ncbi:hypothetical protein IP510_03605 [Psychrobacter sp. NG254]|uniref:hypothetical protein n=1 Tax=Psychrobacter sp. NG254 TaxID=2782003 RepID=UPI0018890DC3|nr:hypothetical protein [Psychrobacter sp. NG254]MBF2718972.1 hypothetical protein [Psychrobacter sp. NG254]
MNQETITNLPWDNVCRIVDKKLTLKKVLQTLALDFLDLNQPVSIEFLTEVWIKNFTTSDKKLVFLAECYDCFEEVEILLNFFKKLDNSLNVKLFIFSSKFIKYENDFRVHFVHVPSSTHQEYERKIASHIKRLYEATTQDNTDISFPKDKISTIYSELSNKIKDVSNASFMLEVNLGNVNYEMLCKFTDTTDKIIIFGQDALTRSKVSLPYFFRWKWMDDIDANIIILNDPTLYKDEKINGGWFVGDEKRDYVSEFSKILKTIIKSRNISNIVNFYGASAGGFSVLSISSFFEESKVIVDIPQINLLTYHASKEIEPLAIHCFNMNLSQIQSSKYLYRFNVIDRLKANENVPNLLYLHNIHDTLHENQVKEFTSRWLELVSRYGKNKRTNLKFITYDQWHLTKGGHFPLNKYSTIQMMKDFFEL